MFETLRNTNIYKFALKFILEKVIRKDRTHHPYESDVFEIYSEQRIIDLLNKYELPAKKFMDTWRLTGYVINHDDVGYWKMATYHIKCMEYLEDQGSGVTKTLYETFGLINFGRYDPNSLLEQYHKRDDKYCDWTFVFTSCFDHNYSFDSSYGIWKTFSEGFKAIEKYNNPTIRYIEAGSKKDFNEILESLKDRYKTKATFGIIASHANEHGMTAFNTYNVDLIFKIDKHLSYFEFMKFRKLIVPNGILLLFGCEVMKLNSVMQSFSNLLKIRVCGFKQKPDTHYSPIFNIDHIDNPDLKISFRDSDGKTANSIILNPIQ